VGSAFFMRPFFDVRDFFGMTSPSAQRAGCTPVH
jgi:hypothetical protein